MSRTFHHRKARTKRANGWRCTCWSCIGSKAYERKNNPPMPDPYELEGLEWEIQGDIRDLSVIGCGGCQARVLASLAARARTVRWKSLPKNGSGFTLPRNSRQPSRSTRRTGGTGGLSRSLGSIGTTGADGSRSASWLRGTGARSATRRSFPASSWT
jgi:hypothetical protein